MAKRTCAIEGCDGLHKGRGWCANHYARWVRTGNPNGRKRQPGPQRFVRCGECDESKPFFAKGFCKRCYMNRWARTHPATETSIASRKRWRAANPQKIAKGKARYRKSNAASVNTATARRRARKQAVLTIDFTQHQLDQRLSMFPGCWICGDEATQVDHVKPISKGGPHILANLRPACASCNSRKKDKWPYEPDCGPRRLIA